jgi:hypothetical protein
MSKHQGGGMNPVWIAFWFGRWCIMVIALCMAAKRGDDIPYCHCDDAEQGRACGTCDRL